MDAHVHASERLVEDLDRAPRGMQVQRRDAQQGRLAGAVGTEDDPPFAAAHGPIDPVEDGGPVTDQADTGHPQRRHRSSLIRTLTAAMVDRTNTNGRAVRRSTCPASHEDPASPTSIPGTSTSAWSSSSRPSLPTATSVTIVIAPPARK